MTKAAVVAFASILSLNVASAVAATGYQKAHFGATKPGSWAQYTTQTGTRRAVQGSFVLSVYEGTPLYGASVTVDPVK